jgi:hypothetical protein
MDKDIKYALEYHEATKHSEASLMTSRHYLDFDNKPIPFKIYLELPSITLPVTFPAPEANAISCITNMIHQRTRDMKGTTTTTSENRASAANTPNVDIKDLAEILFFSAGILLNCM